MSGARAGRLSLAIAATRAVLGVEFERRRIPFAELLRRAHAVEPRATHEVAPLRGLRAVRRVRGALGLAPNCLLESLALVRLLRVHGHRALLEIGVRPAVWPFQAHAWVEIEGAAVDGAEREPREGRYRKLEPSRSMAGARSRVPSQAAASRELSSPSTVESE